MSFSSPPDELDYSCPEGCQVPLEDHDPWVVLPLEEEPGSRVYGLSEPTNSLETVISKLLEFANDYMFSPEPSPKEPGAPFIPNWRLFIDTNPLPPRPSPPPEEHSWVSLPIKLFNF